MKKLSLACMLMLLMAGISSCKKEISPEIEITVLNESGNAVRGVKVKTSVDGANRGILNSRVLDSTRTDDFGKAYFKYENTVLIDVAAYRGQEIVDSTSILAETKRKNPKEDNVYERVLIYR